MEITSRSEAKSRGLTHYFTGKECRHGHVSLRYVTSMGCRECSLTEEKLSKASARSKAWYIKNRERQKRRAAEWYSNNKSHALAMMAISSKKWWKKNPDKRRIYNHTRRALERNLGGSYTPQDITDILKQQLGKCAYCRERLGKKFHVDHIMPLVLGGTNERHNLQVLCRSCNLHKSGTDPVTHVRKLGLLL
jgi:5-methylcytosine-specific restriction endonuclease McrA